MVIKRPPAGRRCRRPR